MKNFIKKIFKVTSKKMTPEKWIISQDTGMSSKVIWGVMMGSITEKDDNWTRAIPCDVEDFSRCYRLLKHFPSWEKKLKKVSKIFPKWEPFVKNWNKLSDLFKTNQAGQLSNVLYKMSLPQP